jgi:hypothetical protein
MKLQRRVSKLIILIAPIVALAAYPYKHDVTGLIVA